MWTLGELYDPEDEEDDDDDDDEAGDTFPGRLCDAADCLLILIGVDIVGMVLPSDGVVCLRGPPHRTNPTSKMPHDSKELRQILFYRSKRLL